MVDNAVPDERDVTHFPEDDHADIEALTGGEADDNFDDSQVDYAALDEED